LRSVSLIAHRDARADRLALGDAARPVDLRLEAAGIHVDPAPSMREPGRPAPAASWASVSLSLPEVREGAADRELARAGAGLRE
jgi:hypothetical protein